MTVKRPSFWAIVILHVYNWGYIGYLLYRVPMKRADIKEVKRLLLRARRPPYIVVYICKL
jgi:hypothetical protein